MNSPRHSIPVPSEIKLHQPSQRLKVSFSDGKSFSFTCEFLRAHSPSAEVRGHGAGQEVLQTGKKHIEVVALEPVGNYAVRPRYSDGNDTGIYSWEYLYHLGQNQETLWNNYFARLAAAGQSRDG